VTGRSGRTSLPIAAAALARFSAGVIRRGPGLCTGSGAAAEAGTAGWAALAWAHPGDAGSAHDNATISDRPRLFIMVSSVAAHQCPMAELARRLQPML